MAIVTPVKTASGARRRLALARANGPEGLLGDCHLRAVLVDRFGGRQAAAPYAYRSARASQMQRIMGLLWGSRLGRWLA
jgi:hypothetical protein